ncbi:beta-glucan synthesis-associated [Clavulina sp. PMI_390]|nr:beta-glucan synthesis-associated [Clavulina sp. PMI_390]
MNRPPAPSYRPLNAAPGREPNRSRGFSNSEKTPLPRFRYCYLHYSLFKRLTLFPFAVGTAFNNILDRLANDVGHYALGRGANAHMAEPDDWLHSPHGRLDRSSQVDINYNVFTFRGIGNLGFIIFLGLGLFALFGGYPLISALTSRSMSKLGSHGLGGINASGQVPEMANHFGLIDPDTPQSAYTITSSVSTTFDLVFSDEFNVDNRTFYPGDDPYWEAVDIHYWATGDWEWYDPSAAVTKDGSLQITLSKEDIHDLNYKSAMVTSWNKFCFSGGYIEVNVSLPGDPRYAGLWPATWMMGNLGRAGYGATTDGTWPYTYDSCDWGTLPNQTYDGQPSAVYSAALSSLPGQRLSACTCPNDPNHPGPQRSDGTFYGRAAPELDIFEASSDSDGTGTVSQSVQVAPFNAGYDWSQGSNDAIVYDSTKTRLNGFKGGIYQEAVSAVSATDQLGYEVHGLFSTYGVEWKPGPDGYITWFMNGQRTWTLNPSAIGADSGANISARLIPEEPMYIIMNLGFSYGFGGNPSPYLTFPTTMKWDYIRVYQDPNSPSFSCNPVSHPTENYINANLEAYMNPNLTTFSGEVYGSFNATLPRNSIVDGC